MATYKTPGSYVEEIPKFPPSIAAVDTAIPAFIGYTEFAKYKDDGDLHLKPTRIESLPDYEQLFGGAQKETKLAVKVQEWTSASPGQTPGVTATATLSETERSKHILYYALQMFFANGGGTCYIVSVKPFKDIGDPLDAGDLANGLPPLMKCDEPTLIVIPEAQGLAINDFITLHEAALAQCQSLKDRFTIMDMHGGDAGFLSDDKTNLSLAVDKFRENGFTEDANYGAVYGPNVETVLDFVVDEGQIQVSSYIDATGPDTKMLAALQSTNNKSYELAKAAIRDLPCKLPPSGAVAGVYAAVDSERGVWKAPANVGLKTVIKPTIEFSNVEQDRMNIDPTAGKSINAIRPFVGRGTLVWGARTLAGNDNEWRYVPVRRFFIFVEESVKKATSQFTFEPNDANTWVKVQAMIENFLTTQWRQGALQGVKPEHAFYVAVGLGKTMTALDILEGRMIVEIGMAAVRPAEFIILRFSHLLAQS